MSSAQSITSRVFRESRADRAERSVSLEGAPAIEHEYRRGGTVITGHWRAHRLILIWDTGVLARATLRGTRLLKSGLPGKITESAHFEITEIEGQGRLVTPLKGSRTEAPYWLLDLIEEYGAKVPAHKSIFAIGA